MPITTTRNTGRRITIPKIRGHLTDWRYIPQPQRGWRLQEHDSLSGTQGIWLQHHNNWEHDFWWCWILTANTRHPPFMGIIIITQTECPLHAIKRCRTDKVCPKWTLVLVCWNNLVYIDRDKLSIPVTETEPYWCYFSICISTRNHLHRSIYTQDCFHYRSLHILKTQILNILFRILVKI